MTDHGSSTTSTAYCYRHPDRATRISCSDCGRPICVDCTHDAVVGQKCPECAAPVGRGRVIDARTIRRVDRSTTPVTWTLIAVNVAIFLIGWLDPATKQRIFVEAAQWREFFQDGVARGIENGEVWRVASAMFLHANLTHILFNMWALYLFGPSLERRFGSASFASLYVAAGLGGAALYHGLGRLAPAVGASGAIFGLMGALLAATYRQRHTMAGRAVFSQLGLLLVLNLSLPLLISNIAWEAHVGGLVAGMAIAEAWDHIGQGRPGATRRVAVAAVVAVLAFGSVFL